MATCPHLVLKKITLPPPVDNTVFYDQSHCWYRCAECKQVVFLAMTLEYSPAQLKRIIEGAEGP